MDSMSLSVSVGPRCRQRLNKEGALTDEAQKKKTTRMDRQDRQRLELEKKTN